MGKVEVRNSSIYLDRYLHLWTAGNQCLILNIHRSNFQAICRVCFKIWLLLGELYFSFPRQVGFVCQAGPTEPLMPFISILLTESLPMYNCILTLQVGNYDLAPYSARPLTGRTGLSDGAAS